MAITYQWRIERFTVTPNVGDEHDVIRSVEWRMSGTDGVHSVIGLKGGDTYPYGYGSTDFPPPEPDNFQPFENFTQEQLNAFLDQAVPESDKIKIRQNIDQQLAQLANPALVDKLPPWVNI